MNEETTISGYSFVLKKHFLNMHRIVCTVLLKEEVVSVIINRCSEIGVRMYVTYWHQFMVCEMKRALWS